MADSEEYTWHILLIDDDEDDYLLARELLNQARGQKVKLEWAATYTTGQQRLSSTLYDAVLVDYDLGAKTGIELICEFVSQGYPAPLILYTGRGTYEVDVEAMQAGATLYLTKSETTPLLLERAIRYAIERKQIETQLLASNESLAASKERLAANAEKLANELAERKRAEDALRQSEQRLRWALQGAGGGAWDWDLLSGEAWWSHEMYTLWGIEPGTRMYLDNSVALVHEQDRQRMRIAVEESIAHHTDYQCEFRIHHSQRGECWMASYGRPVYDEAGLPLRLLGISLDITERKRTEHALQEANERLQTQAEELEVQAEELRAQTDELVAANQHLHARESELRLIMDATPALISYVGADYRYRRVNREYERWFGHTAEAVQGRHMRDVLGVAAWQAIRPYAKQALAGEVVTYETELPYHEGGARWVNVTYTPDRDPAGRVQGFVAHVVDIGERKRAEGAVQRSEAMLRAVLDQMPSGVTVRDARTGELILSNARGQEIMGGLVDTADQFDHYLGLHPGGRPYQTEEWPVYRSITTGEIVDAEEIECQRSDGTRITLSTSSAPVRDAQEQIIFGVGVFLDITERKRAEEGLRESEQRYSAIFGKSPIAIALTRMPEGITVSVNDAFLELFEYTRAEVVGKTSVDLGITDQDSRAEVAALLQARGSVRDFECTRNTKSGAQRVLLLNLDRVSIGGEQHVLTMVQDITDRKRVDLALLHANELLQEQAEELAMQAEELRLQADELVAANQKMQARENELRLIMDATPALISYVDAKYRYIRVNRGYERWFGCTAGEVQGKHVWEVLGEAAFQASRPYLDRALAGEVIIYETRMPYREGGARWIRATLTPDRDASGSVQGFVGHVVDIEEIKKAEEALLAYTEHLRNTNQALEDFASIASHDLQEPLRKIQAFGGLLKSHFSPELGDQGQDYIERMQQAAARMQSMLDGLLAYARITSQGQHFSRVDLQQVTSEVLSDLEARLMETGGQVEVDPLPVIEADPLQIRQLFQNLLGNALKFHHPNVPPLVKITCSAAGENAIALTIADNGIGIEAKEAGYLFKPFHRLQEKSEFEGSGMGLAICQKIVERHGGSITVNSQPGEGTTFRVTLPIYTVS